MIIWMVRDSLSIMDELITAEGGVGTVVEKIRFSCLSPATERAQKHIKLMDIRSLPYKLSTVSPQRLWKRLKCGDILKVIVLMLCLCVALASCASSKAAKKEVPKKVERTAADEGIISMSEEEVRKKLGTPTTVSKMTDNRILWTYRPSWKLMPDNAGTVYIEFENGKAAKITRVR